MENLQEWTADFIFGIKDRELLLSRVTIAEVPCDPATGALIEFLKMLELTETEECKVAGRGCRLVQGAGPDAPSPCLDCILEKYETIVNCSTWEATTPINLASKFNLIRTLLWEEEDEIKYFLYE